MKPYLLVYICGLLLVLVGERVIDEGTSATYICSGLGCVALLGSIFLSRKAIIDLRKDQHKAFQLPTILTTLGFFAILCFLASGDATAQWLSLEDESARKWTVFTQSLGGILLLSSALPLFSLQALFANNPQHVNDRRAKTRALHWLGAAFALAALFPINFIAHDANIKWDLGYFKTAMPGESSKGIVANLSEPVTAYLFFSNSNKVSEEVRGYFTELKGNNFTTTYVDHAEEPDLAKDLNVRENGYIALVKGEGAARQIERIKVGKDFSTARRTLKKLDEKVRESLLKIAKDADVLYFTTGHGEMYWKLDENDDQSRKVSYLKKILSSSNFTTKELNITNGLANEIPEDASVVMILAPSIEFSEAEIETLQQYWNSGGSLFIALEPSGRAPTKLLNTLGVEYTPVSLGHNQSRMPSRAKASITDAYNLITNKYSTHASVTNLSRFNKLYFMVFSNTGAFSKTDGTEAKVKEIIKSPDKTWPDNNGNYKQDQDESGKIWNLAMAVEQTFASDDTELESRAILFGDGTWLNDQFIGQGYNAEGQVIRPHAMAFANALFWLTAQEQLAGDVSNENDIKIQHTQKGQRWIFFSTILFIPIGLLSGGFLRIRYRKKKGES